ETRRRYVRPNTERHALPACATCGQGLWRWGGRQPLSATIVMHSKGATMGQKKLLQLAKKNSTPHVIVDHQVLRENYAQFRQYLPRVQVYYAVKANSDPAIVQTFYDVGASFDVASVAEFLIVHEKIQHLPAQQRQDFIWDRIIYANPIKA